MNPTMDPYSILNRGLHLAPGGPTPSTHDAVDPVGDLIAVRAYRTISAVERVARRIADKVLGA